MFIFLDVSIFRSPTRFTNKSWPRRRIIVPGLENCNLRLEMISSKMFDGIRISAVITGLSADI